jgi:glycosyltransferase involved in cell wall biosynthesis
MRERLITAAKSGALTLLHVIPTLEGGGAERQLSMLAAEQARRGYDVHLAVRRTGVHVQAIKGRSIHIHELGDIRSINPRLLLAVRRVIVKFKPEIVQTWLPQMDIVGGLGALASGVPWVISERTSAKYYKEIPTIAPLRLLVGQFASAIIANSHDGEKYWQEGAYRFLRVNTVRNALDVERIQETVALGLQKADSNPLLLVVGRFSREKALEVIVRALSKLHGNSSVSVLMIGEGNERPTLEKEIAAASLSKRIRVLPYQPDWWRWLKVADGLISMSRYEGNPNVVLEAMAGCCPVILSDIPAHREIADASSAIFVPVDDVHELSAAIVQLVTDRAAALRRAGRARERVGSMTVTTMADAYEAIYQELLGRK